MNKRIVVTDDCIKRACWIHIDPIFIEAFDLNNNPKIVETVFNIMSSDYITGDLISEYATDDPRKTYFCLKVARDGRWEVRLKNAFKALLPGYSLEKSESVKRSLESIMAYIIDVLISRYLEAKENVNLYFTLKNINDSIVLYA